MSDKLDDLILEINKTSLSKEIKQILIDKGREVKKFRTIVNGQFSVVDSNVYKPNTIIKGDILTVLPNGLVHPGLVIKVDLKRSMCYVIPITNDDSFLGLVTEIQSNRFLTGYLTCTLQVMSIENALRYWKGNIGSVKELNRLIHEYKLFYKKLLSL